VSSEYVELDSTHFSLAVSLTCETGQAFLDLGNYSNMFDVRIEMLSANTVVELDDLTVMSVRHRTGSPRDSKGVERLELGGLDGGFARAGYAGALDSFARSARGETTSASGLRNSHDVLLVISRIVGQVLRKETAPWPTETR
jgi:hypothetical protein